MNDRKTPATDERRQDSIVGLHESPGTVMCRKCSAADGCSYFVGTNQSRCLLFWDVTWPARSYEPNPEISGPKTEKQSHE